MKILIVSNLYPPHILGGYEILCAQVCEEYARRGHEVLVVTSDHGVAGASPAEESISGVRVRRSLRLYLPFGTAPVGLYRHERRQVGEANAAAINHVLAEWTPDVVHVWSQLRLSLGAAQACLRRGIPIVYSFNDEHVAGYRPAPWGLQPRKLAAWFLDRFLFRDITLAALPMKTATAISQVTKRNLEKVGVHAQHFPVIYQGIPVDQFPGKEEPGNLHDPLRLLYVGQLHRYKGVHAVIEAAHLLAGQGKAVAVTIAGAGEVSYEEELRRLADSGPAQVHFAGKVGRDKIAAVYREHDVFVFASVWEEPFGLTHLEAMASGLPVISTLCGGQGEFLRPEENCLSFEPDLADDLASKIRRFMEDPALTRRIALAGQATARTDFSVVRYVDDLEKLLRLASS